MKAMKLTAAVEYCKSFGLNNVQLTAEGDPLVFVKQDWTSQGIEVGRLILARGKYAGTRAGDCYAK